MGKIVVYLTRFIFLISILPIIIVSADFELNNIISDANKTDKHLLLFFHKDGCRFCEKMIFNFEDSNISKAIKKDFIFVDINRDDNETISFQEYNGTTQEFLKKLGIEFYPTITFLDGNSRFVYSIVGYRNKKNILTILDYIQNRLYKKVTFEEFEDGFLSNKE